MKSPVHVPRTGCQAMRPPPLSIPAPTPPLLPRVQLHSSTTVPSFPPLPYPGPSILQVGNPGLEFCEGEGARV